jgi:hypothetical protein
MLKILILFCWKRGEKEKKKEGKKKEKSLNEKKNLNHQIFHEDVGR